MSCILEVGQRGMRAITPTRSFSPPRIQVRNNNQHVTAETNVSTNTHNQQSPKIHTTFENSITSPLATTTQIMLQLLPNTHNQPTLPLTSTNNNQAKQEGKTSITRNPGKHRSLKSKRQNIEYKNQTLQSYSIKHMQHYNHHSHMSPSIKIHIKITRSYPTIN